jgi:hypothetical protein
MLTPSRCGANARFRTARHVNLEGDLAGSHNCTWSSTNLRQIEADISSKHATGVTTSALDPLPSHHAPHLRQDAK